MCLALENGDSEHICNVDDETMRVLQTNPGKEIFNNYKAQMRHRNQMVAHPEIAALQGKEDFPDRRLIGDWP